MCRLLESHCVISKASFLENGLNFLKSTPLGKTFTVLIPDDVFISRDFTIILFQKKKLNILIRYFSKKEAFTSLPIRETINGFNIHTDIKSFLNFTFDIIESGEAHKIASAFTFGRENVIPDMFIGLVKGLNEKNSDIANKFVYYLERHIELDGEDHGPIALKMIENLCGDDEKKWDEVTKIAKESIQMRIKLWDHICNEIKS